jgi:hypothetical protein
MRLTGGIESACFGTRVDLSTITPLRIVSGQPCPAAGKVELAYQGRRDQVEYASDGVRIDVGSDGSVEETFSTCLDPRLFACPTES